MYLRKINESVLSIRILRYSSQNFEKYEKSPFRFLYFINTVNVLVTPLLRFSLQAIVIYKKKSELHLH